MATGKDASRIGAERRWREGIFLGLCCAGQSANDDAVEPPDGVKAARAIKLEADESAWDVELHLSVKGRLWDRKRRDPTIRVSVPRTPLPSGVPFANRVSRRKGSWPATDVRSERTSRSVVVRSNSGMSRWSCSCHGDSSINLPQQRMQETSGKCNA